MKSSLFCLLVTVLGVLLTPTDALAISNDDAYRLRQALAAFGHEPDVYAVQSAAVDHRNRGQSPPENLARRARLSALLPQLQGQASWLDQRDLRHRFRENIAADDDGNYERNHAQHYLYDDLRLRGLYSLRLTFDLSQLAFHRQEIAIRREVQSHQLATDALLEEVTELYFARRRHQLYLRLFPDADLEEQLRHHLAVDALTARIDALTGGWFRTALEESDS